MSPQNSRIESKAPVASVIVPAHNEEAVIGRLLREFDKAPSGARFQVIVSCNGCNDNTAALSRESGAIVVETNIASKAAALNAGDKEATSFPRLYIDADIRVSLESIVELAEQSATEQYCCYSLPIAAETAGRPWLIQAYYRYWLLTPYMRNRHVGSGIYALSAKGRARFEKFPSLMGDDLFIRNCFIYSERCVVDAEPFVIEAPWTTRALLLRRIRVYRGINELSRDPACKDMPGATEAQQPWWKPLCADYKLFLSAFVYCSINMAARLVALWKDFREQPQDWAKDETTRMDRSG